MKINELTKEVHDNAVNHGWWEEERSFGDLIALCHSELSEALKNTEKVNSQQRHIIVKKTGKWKEYHQN